MLNPGWVESNSSLVIICITWDVFFSLYLVYVMMVIQETISWSCWEETVIYSYKIFRVLRENNYDNNGASNNILIKCQYQLASVIQESEIQNVPKLKHWPKCCDKGQLTLWEQCKLTMLINTLMSSPAPCCVQEQNGAVTRKQTLGPDYLSLNHASSSVKWTLNEFMFVKCLEKYLVIL
jgi:hypothetical protein